MRICLLGLRLRIKNREVIGVEWWRDLLVFLYSCDFLTCSKTAV
jgi:hypothetical protein